ncbi:MAG: hypothetical protein SVU69_09240 [Pseudomonadota bacterium]|nr:hypothetical protein [Pseudomonadota bacterium]
MGDVEFLHQQSIEGVRSRYLTHWYDTELQGTYLIENTLEGGSKNPSSPPVVLIPGGFDPVRGSYSQGLVTKLLKDVGVSAVYEAHYRYEGKCGYIEMPLVVDDLKNLLRNESANPVMVGLSASTFALSAALVAAGRESSQQAAKAILLIGAYIPGHVTLLGKALGPFYRREKMRQKVLRHCGHPYLFDNSVRMREWWDSYPEFRTILEKRDFDQLRERCSIPVELLFFRIDTLSWSGRRTMRKMFDAKIWPKTIPGHHRGLRYVPEADEIISQICDKLIQPPSGLTPAVA